MVHRQRSRAGVFPDSVSGRSVGNWAEQIGRASQRRIDRVQLIEAPILVIADDLSSTCPRLRTPRLKNDSVTKT